jgi:ABC-2 type transport system permease protein
MAEEMNITHPVTPAVIRSIARTPEFVIVKNALCHAFHSRFDLAGQLAAACARILVQVCLWRSVYELIPAVAEAEEPTPKIILYAIAAALVRSTFSTNVSGKMAEKVQDGSIVLEFSRPMKLRRRLLCEQLGESLARLCLYVVPTSLVLILILRPTVSWSPAMAVAPLLLAGGFYLVFLIDYMFSFAAFWLRKNSYTERINSALFDLLSGAIVPIWLFPSPLAEIALRLPYSQVVYQPVRALLGLMTPKETVMVLGMQAGWIAILLALQAVVWARLQRRLSFEGG